MAPFQTPMEHYLLSPLLHLLVALIPDLHSGSGGSVDKLCPTLWSLLGSSVHGILWQEYWNRLPCPSPGGLPDPGIKPYSLTLQ